MESPFGFLVIDKPSGITSHDCVSRLRKIYGIKRIGHGGTLDPGVTGLLPIALGNATRLLPYLPSQKTYEGTIQLGISTTTDDLEGEIISRQSWPNISFQELEKYLDEFRGVIQQCPPQFSSVHLKGERAYQKARRGEAFHLPPKEVTIYKLNLIKWEPSSGEIQIKLHCSSGTYVRSIARDLGNKIKCGGSLAKLRRTQALGFKESQSIKLPNNSKTIDIPEPINPLEVLNHLPRIKLETEEENLYWRSGRKLLISQNRWQQLEYKSIRGNNESIPLVVLNNMEELVGIAITEEDSIIHPKIVFNALG